jgi:hypothetical protein
LKSIKIVGGPLLSEKIDLLLRGIKEIPELKFFLPLGKSEGLRKLSSFPDKELKVRVIAIGDYFSQTALRPLHNFLFRILKRINQDMTFDQNKFKETCLNHKVYYSLDLSSATDRFPIELIYKVLRGRFPLQYVDAWKDIMVGYPFRFKPTNNDNIMYSTGNPMGFCSS